LGDLSPMEGWCRSLPKVLLLPFAVWLILAVLHYRGELAASLLAGMLAGSIGMLIHFVSYGCLGIPLYLLFWTRESLIWKWYLAIPLGILLGGLVINLLATVILRSPAETGLFIGAGYGGLTAVGACWSRSERR
ncbi:MAG: hypothetical protein AAGJ35_11920, partial [Myxococcota bacterium]